ncbi:hypothetical protein ACGIF2_03015 [Cellulomonas sp. P22]|uniref:hypothetical protein n=1 Tax=Cellulomonas sp. P22 TaxID=3373189 RepID=UPI00379EDD96
MTHDLLTHLADVEIPTAEPDLARVTHRAHSLRRARRARLAGGTGLVVAVLAVGGVTLPQGGQGPTGNDAPLALALGAAPAQAADAGVACNTGTAEWVDRADWSSEPDVVAAASLVGDVALPLTGIGVHHDEAACWPTVPVAVLFSEAPVSGVTIWADVADPFPEGTDGVRDVTVRGTDARLRVFDNGSMAVAWTAPDGTTWLASGSGMDEATLLATIDGLRFDGSRVLDVESVPAGLEPATIDPQPVSRTTTRWWAAYGDPDAQIEDAGVIEPVPGAGMLLEAISGWTAPVEVAASSWAQGVRFVDVDGARGTFSPWGGDATSDAGGWLTWHRDGTSYTLSGAFPLAVLTAAATTVEKVDLMDPQVTGAPEYPAAG